MIEWVVGIIAVLCILSAIESSGKDAERTSKYEVKQKELKALLDEKRAYANEIWKNVPGLTVEEAVVLSGYRKVEKEMKIREFEEMSSILS